jgi:hypothetical protein
LFLAAITPFFGIYYDKSQGYRFGQKPERFADSGRLTKRQLLQISRKNESQNAILEARRYHDCLEAVSGRTRAEVAVMFEVSRARVSQYLNLLKLPRAIVGFLEANEDPTILRYFSERRLRSLTQLNNDNDKWNEFMSMATTVTAKAGFKSYPAFLRMDQ